jgi:hypothetical protein
MTDETKSLGAAKSRVERCGDPSLVPAAATSDLGFDRRSHRAGAFSPFHIRRTTE